ncbi:MAG: hypothetical protein GXO31_01375 [Epsilonproteobacteria bacterium]|nr:hypothetical protein [Campylobacterota bacterium]
MLRPSNKTAINLSIGFFKGNYALSFAAISILFVISLLTFIPILGLFFLISYAIFSLSIQIYFAKSVEEIEQESQIEEVAASTKIGDFLNKHFSTAAGGFVGMAIVSLLFFFLTGVLFALMGSGAVSVEEMKTMSEEQLTMTIISSYSIPILLISFIGGFLFYVFPAVMGYVMNSNNFNEAFKNSFLILNPKFWRRTFNKEYFVLVFIWSIIATLLTMIAFFASAVIVLIPISIILLYLLSLYNAAIYIFSKDLLK